MTVIEEISRIEFDKAENVKTVKGNQKLNGKVLYGFFAQKCFYYTVDHHYFEAAIVC